MKSKEAILQSECYKWFLYQYPQYKYNFFAIPNGGSRHKIEAANLKRQGVLAGVSDMFLAVAHDNTISDEHMITNGLFIEFKSPKGKQTPEQKEFELTVQREGYLYVVINSFDRFVEVINQYLT